jgi:deazaflavin-dependent oxidoreductase (nitroreductase family)
MPLPKTLARFNRRVTNPFFRSFAGWLPPFAIAEHRGRRSGRRYETPICAFKRPEGWIIALTYGPQSDWVENVLAAGGCRLKARGRWHALSRPRLVEGAEWRRLLPPIPRTILAFNKVDLFLCLEPAGR